MEDGRTTTKHPASLGSCAGPARKTAKVQDKKVERFSLANFSGYVDDAEAV
jgi:hypothetical protein